MPQVKPKKKSREFAYKSSVTDPKPVNVGEVELEFPLHLDTPYEVSGRADK